MTAADAMADIVERIIAEIGKGAAEWRMPWNAASGLPHNAITQKPYRGGNTIALWVDSMIHGYTSSRWATYKQWQSIDAQVRRGEHGTRLIRWVDAMPGDADDDRTERVDSRAPTRMIPVAFTVFNAGQVDQPDTDTAATVDLEHPDAARFLDAVPADVRWGAGTPCYRPATDTVHMPARDAFHSPAAASATLAHELAHWTGHPDRLARDLTGRFGDDSYAAEELIAEMSAAFTCATVNIAPAIRDDHAPYLAHWLRILRAEPRRLWSVASAAQAATDHLAAYSIEQLTIPVVSQATET